MNGITRLKVLFGLILLVMVVTVTWATLNESILKIPATVTSDPWFIATLADAYCGFLTFYAWLFYRETAAISRLIWFILIMGLGNIAMAIYVLLIVLRLPPNASPADVLLRPNKERLS
ncbi:MAG: DUF1475 family protein [Cyanobacteria bacterium P01_H01_bin.74]